MSVPQVALYALDIFFTTWFPAGVMRSVNRFDSPRSQAAARPPYSQLLKASAFFEFPGRSKSLNVGFVRRDIVIAKIN
jgi:hypothetical protein